MATLEERFWAKVDKSGDCWLWTAYITTEGYGQIGVKSRLRLAHRLSYEWAHGEIPEGMKIDHTCHVRHCVRPDHLRLATNKQNMENLSGLISTNTSGVRGVSWDKWSGKWVGRIKHNGRPVHVGLFRDLVTAEAAVVAKRNELFTHNELDRRGQK